MNRREPTQIGTSASGLRRRAAGGAVRYLLGLREAVPRAVWALATLGWKVQVGYLVLTAVAVAAVMHARSYSGEIIDDAFITFRYSWNLVHGNGLTFNPGERVEGTSSSPFALLIAVPLAMGRDPYRAAALLGSLAFAACCWAAYLGVRACVRDESGRLLGLSAALLVASSAQLAFHSQTGLETLLYASLVAFALALQLADSASNHAQPTWATVFAVAALVRPEGFAFFLLAFAIGCAFRGRAPGAIKRAQLELARFAIVFGPWLLFRRLYYGAWLPNSVLAKGGHMGWLLHSTVRAALLGVVDGPGGTLLKDYAQSHILASALLVGTLLLKQTRQAGVTVLAFTLGCAALAVWSDGDWMPFDRTLTPCITPLAMGAALGLRGLFFHAEQRTRVGHAPSYALTALALVLMVLGARTRLAVESKRSVDLARVRRMGERLAPLARKDDLLATELAGILPFYWQTKTLDMAGLCDAHIAANGTPTRSGAGRKEVEYVSARRPTFYAFNLVSEAADFYTQPAFTHYHEEYALLQFPYRFLAPLKALPLTVFVRKDRKELAALTRAVGGRLVDPGAELKRLGYLD